MKPRLQVQIVLLKYSTETLNCRNSNPRTSPSFPIRSLRRRKVGLLRAAAAPQPRSRAPISRSVRVSRAPQFICHSGGTRQLCLERNFPAFLTSFPQRNVIPFLLPSKTHSSHPIYLHPPIPTPKFHAIPTSSHSQTSPQPPASLHPVTAAAVAATAREAKTEHRQGCVTTHTRHKTKTRRSSTSPSPSPNHHPCPYRTTPKSYRPTKQPCT
jgi:hypothetical protein